jgi:hypothetical protein
VLASNQRTSNETNEDHEKYEVENSISDDTSLPQLGLLEGIYWGADLTARAGQLNNHQAKRQDIPRSKPEEHDGVELVNVRNAERR